MATSIRYMAAFVCGAVAPAAWAQSEGPPQGITVQATQSGLVYADATGATLYTSLLDDKLGVSNCTGERFREGRDGFRNVKHPLIRLDARPSCIQKSRPAAVASGAVSMNRWSIVERADGIRQWAYGGKPLYTAAKDRTPGEVNASFGRPLFAPVSLPPGVTVVRPEAGGAYLAAGSKPIFAAPKGERPPPANSAWIPLAAPELAESVGAWAVAVAKDGSRRWTHEGRALYLHDGADPLPDALPRGWTVAALARRARLPADFATFRTLEGRVTSGNIVTTRTGATVYVYACQEDGPDKLDCDDPADASPLWTTLCGGIERCAQTFRPVVPGRNARPDGKVWSIVTIPSTWSPVRAADGQAGIKVWAYRGRPVFTYAKDHRRGDTDGEIGYQGRQWTALDAGEF